MQKRHRIIRKRGHSLLEVTIALFVSALLLGPALLLCVQSYRMSRQGQAWAAAYTTAQRQLELVRGKEWAARIPSGVTGDISFSIPSEANDALFAAGVPASQRMQGTYRVTNFSATVQQVSVRVTWPSLVAKGKTSEVCLDTLIAKP